MMIALVCGKSGMKNLKNLIGIATAVLAMVGNNATSQTFSTNQFQIINGSYTWDAAKLDAQSRGGHLATITSQANRGDNSAIRQIFSRIGLCCSYQ